MPHRQRGLRPLAGSFLLFLSFFSFTSAAPLARSSDPPAYEFGVVTDIQYADVNDTVSAKGVPRYYRWSLEQVKAATGAFARDKGLSFALSLGDLVDMRAARTREGAEGALSRVLALLRGGGFPAPWRFALGNHDVASFRYDELSRLLALNATGEQPPGATSAYSTFVPAPGHRVIILDPYDLSMHGRNASDPMRVWAERFLLRHNRNADKNNPDLLPPGEPQRFNALNGAFGVPQRVWLADVLQAADVAKERVVVVSHALIHPDQASAVCRHACLAWNYDSVLRLLRRHGGAVVAVLSGHDHYGNYTRDEQSGIHFVTLQGMMDTPRGVSTFGTVRVFGDRLEIHGRGRLVNRTLEFPPLGSPMTRKYTPALVVASSEAGARAATAARASAAAYSASRLRGRPPPASIPAVAVSPPVKPPPAAALILPPKGTGGVAKGAGEGAESGNGGEPPAVAGDEGGGAAGGPSSSSSEESSSSDD